MPISAISPAVSEQNSSPAELSARLHPRCGMQPKSVYYELPSSCPSKAQWSSKACPARIMDDQYIIDSRSFSNSLQ
ncbi:hypothetical protein AVEN_228157-1 [Araneus ventricosus]|uniref:Uncharacterized protein n=1 Tax=Araneus ventricosus TaxID=182803 RepID=A0A4Y2CUR1_ARAVE|nr:hypothetical protein AVEN_228157-1 [Araneus ventricosus]